ILPIVQGMRSTIIGRDGAFALTLPCGVGRVLNVEAVQHQVLWIPAITASGQVLEIEARLIPLEWAANFDSVRVLREAGGYAAGPAIPMKRRGAGPFAATVPCESESLRYQLLGVAKDGLPTAGTMADTFFLRGGRGVASIRAGGKPVE